MSVYNSELLPKVHTTSPTHLKTSTIEQEAPAVATVIARDAFNSEAAAHSPHKITTLAPLNASLITESAQATLLPQASARHAIRGNIPTKAQIYLARTLAIAGAILLSPLIIAGTAVAGGYVLKNRILTAMDRGKVQEATKQMRSAEEQIKFESLSTAVAQMEEENPQLATQYRTVLTQDDIRKLGCTTQESAEKRVLSDIGKFREFCALLKNNQGGNYARANKLITKKYRELLNSPTYKAFKDDPKDPFVKFIHSYAVANYNKVLVHETFQEFGKTIANETPVGYHQEVIKADTTLTNPEARKKLVGMLEKSYKHISEESFTDHGLGAKLLYALTHRKQALGSLASMGVLGRNISLALGGTVYDPAGELGNNPSLQSTTIMSLPGGQELKINNCYGGSPTIDDRVSPEMEALLQAIRNNNRLPPQERDPNIPSRLCYTNLQNIENKGGEGVRSRIIMELATKFPDEFVAITLAKDSDFYQRKGEFKKASWTSAQAFGQEMLTQLSHDACYSYENRAGRKEGSGIYLGGTKEAWSPVLDEIIAKAANQLEGKLPATTNPEQIYKNRAAFQELVYSLIQAHVEKQAGIKAAEEGQQPFIMAIRACKENVDRGALENLKNFYLYLAGAFPKEPTETDLQYMDRLQNTLLGFMNCRALSARDRVVLRYRTTAALELMKHISPSEFQALIQ